MGDTAIVTGGTGGLGPAVVARLLDDGWRVVVPWVSQGELDRLHDRDEVELIQADLFEPEAVAEVIELASSVAEAPLRGLANLVGGYQAGGRVHETPIVDFEHQLRVNLRATYLVTQAALGPMVEANCGAIVCVGARAAVSPLRGASAYSTAKAAVVAFAQAVSVEYRPEGVRCNAILPSVIDTPGNRVAMPDADHERWVKPHEIAAVVAHLLSAESAPVSGAAIPVYGRA